MSWIASEWKDASISYHPFFLVTQSAEIILDAKRKQYGIAMEKLTGIGKLYRRGDWQGRGYRGMMNSWRYYELQRQIEYKAQWEGIPAIYVNPYGTSVKCSICGSRMARIPKRTDNSSAVPADSS